MVKLSGPLFSIEARGSLGPRLTFSKRKNVNQVRFQRAQKDYANTARLEQRTRFWSAVQWWKDLSADEKSQWETLANR